MKWVVINTIGLISMAFFTQFADTLNATVKHRAISSCSEWTTSYRMIQPKRGSIEPAPFNFQYYPWLCEMHDSLATRNVGQKSAQMGYTELILNWTFYKNDVHKQSVLYVLPTDDNAGDFSASRFDPAIETSPHLLNLYTDTKNKGHKRAGIANLYIRGSRAKNKLISIPVANIAIDELDQMVQEHIELIWERMSGQFEKQSWSISTPTVEGYGINKMFRHTTQEHNFFSCPLCSRKIELTFDNLEICGDNQDDMDYKRSRIFCGECKGTLPQENKYEYLADGKFEKTNDGDSDNRGFYINQLYSSTITPAELALSFLKGLEDDDAEREFFNSKMGVPHVPSSYQISQEDIESCKGNYSIFPDAHSFNTFITMGIDVGTKIHWEVDSWELSASREINDNPVQILNAGSVDHFEELDDIMKQYGVHYCVIDANPERRASVAFTKRHAGRVRYCFYGVAKMDRDINPSIEKPMVSVNRAMWMDLVIKKFKNETIKLPANISIEYQTHLKANVKIVKEDKQGNIIFIYNNLGLPDHFMHTRTYNEIALKCAWNGGMNEDMGDRV